MKTLLACALSAAAFAGCAPALAAPTGSGPPPVAYKFTPPDGLSIIGATEASANGSGDNGSYTGGTTGPDGSNIAVVFRNRLKIFTEAQNPRLVYANGLASTGTGGSLNAGFGTAFTTPLQLKFSLEALSPNGPTVTDQARSPGRSSAYQLQTTLDDSSALVFTTPWSLHVYSGDVWFARVLVNRTSTANYRAITSPAYGGTGAAGDGRMQNGDGASAGGSVYDCSPTGNSGCTNDTNGGPSGAGFGPLMVLGQKVGGSLGPSIACVTDSIGSGSGDGPNISDLFWEQGFCARTAYKSTIPYVLVGVAGTKLSDWANVSQTNLRDQLVSYAPGVVVELGTNDLSTSTARMQANLLTIVKRYFQRYQNVLIADLLPKASSTDDYQTYVNQSPGLGMIDAEYQRRNWNRWVFDNTGASAISNETPQGAVNGANTSFWTQWGFSGTPSCTVGGSAETVTVSDAAGGHIILGSAPANGVTVVCAYIKLQGLGPQLTALAPKRASQWKAWDIAGAVEKDVSGNGISWQSPGAYNPAATAAGYWPLASMSGGSNVFYSGTFTSTAAPSDSNQTSALNTYAGYALKWTSGTSSGTEKLIHFQGNGSWNPTYALPSNPSSWAVGDTYSIIKPPTLDGTHPCPWMHAQIANSGLALVQWAATPN